MHVVILVSDGNIKQCRLEMRGRRHASHMERHHRFVICVRVYEQAPTPAHHRSITRPRVRQSWPWFRHATAPARGRSERVTSRGFAGDETPSPSTGGHAIAPALTHQAPPLRRASRQEPLRQGVRHAKNGSAGKTRHVERGFGRLTSRMAGMATTARSTAAMVKAITYDPVASNIMPENSGPVAVPVLCARFRAPNTAP
jgi:hypothetical protein